METASALLRHYIDLFESDTQTCFVTVERYVGIEQVPADNTPFPAVLTFEMDRTQNSDTITQALKAEIQAATGYEPAKFSWRWTTESGAADSGQMPDQPSR